MKPTHLILALCALSLCAQNSEMTTKDEPIVFRSTTNLIPVPVVVRDANGHAVGNLNVGDFQLSDNGKPQLISKFTLEKLDDKPEVVTAPAPAPTTPDAPPAAAPVAADGIPDRFVAYLFDDLHMNLADLVHTREAAKRQIDSPRHSRERAAVYTTSGRNIQEFTADHAKLDATLDKIGVGAATMAKTLQQNSCPPVTYYMSDQIYNKRNLSAWKIAASDAMSCSGLGGSNLEDPGSDIQEATISGCEASGSTDGVCKAAKLAKEASREILLAGDRDTEASLTMMRSVVSRMGAMPGKRSMVLISSGFLVLEDKHIEMMRIIDQAIKTSVVIGGLDARGLYTQMTGGDASDRVSNPSTIAAKQPFESLDNLAKTDVIANIADGTGGTFYHGTNDFDEGITKVAATPDFLYVLGFSPQDLKMNGSFHTLKVTLKDGRRLDIQARKGYYAASTSVGPAEQAKQQIEEAFFSREEVRDLPVVLQTQFFKTPDGDATLSTVAKIDVKKLTFKKDGDRNKNDVTVVTGLFDSDGNYVSGAQKILEMKLLDQTLETRVGSGISVKQNFTVHPGRYMVRLVVRDSAGQSMSAQSSLVDIP